MGIMQAEARVEFPTEFADIIGKINVKLDEASLEIASQIAADARETTAFRDYTGTPRESEWHKKNFPNATRLRPNIKAKRSKYVGGGAIAYSRGPHSHLVEYGHVLVIKGRVAGNVPAHQFLRPPTKARVEEAIQKFGDAIQQGLGE